MNTLILAIFIYLAYVFIWFLINLVFYFFSLAFKKRVIMNGLTYLSVICIYLLNILIGIGLLWWLVVLFLNGEFLWLILLFFFGISLISGLINLVQFPFIFITSFFSQQIEDIDLKENVVTAEILDKNNKVIGKIEGDTTISVRLAKYFVAFFALNLIGIILFPDEGVEYKWLDYLITPTLQIFGGTLIIGIPYSIYHRIKNKSFFPIDKRYFFIQVWKICVIILSTLSIIVLGLGYVTNTL